MKYCEGKTMCFRKPSVIAYAAVVGKAENEGPYGGEFDEVVEDNKAGSDTWEQGMLRRIFSRIFTRPLFPEMSD